MNLEKLILYGVILILVYKVFFITEKLSNDDITAKISEIYKADVGAIRNLSKLANDLTKNGKLIVHGGIEIDGPLKLKGNLDINGDSLLIGKTKKLLIHQSDNGHGHITHNVGNKWDNGFTINNDGSIGVKGNLSACNGLAELRTYENGYKESYLRLNSLKNKDDYKTKIKGIELGSYGTGTNYLRSYDINGKFDEGNLSKIVYKEKPIKLKNEYKPLMSKKNKNMYVTVKTIPKIFGGASTKLSYSSDKNKVSNLWIV